jgi:hypothetical protein
MSFLRGLIFAGAAVGLSQLAFSKGSRRELLSRDHWTCQNDHCFGYYLGQGALQFGEGWMVQAAHYPNMHQPKEDFDISHGRCLCSTCHLVEEIQRGNTQGSMMLHQRQTIRSREWLEQNEWKDQKMDFRFYYDWAFADERGRMGLAQAYAERFYGEQ